MASRSLNQRTADRTGKASSTSSLLKSSPEAQAPLGAMCKELAEYVCRQANSARAARATRPPANLGAVQPMIITASGVNKPTCRGSALSAVTDSDSVAIDFDSDYLSIPVDAVQAEKFAENRERIIFPMVSKNHDGEASEGFGAFKRPVPKGKNICSAFDYVWCPFPENRPFEVAHSRRIARDLATPGVCTNGLLTKDLVNLPPPHCRKPGTYTPYHYKKRIPLGPWDLLKILSSVVRRTVTRKRSEAHVPIVVPQILSRAACRHYKHVFVPRNDPQRRISKRHNGRPKNRRVSVSPQIKMRS